MINTDLVLDVTHNFEKNLYKVISNRNFEEFLDRASDDQIFKAYLTGMLFKVSLAYPEYINYMGTYDKKTVKLVENRINEIISSRSELFSKYTFKKTSTKDFKRFIDKTVLKSGTTFVKSKNIVLAANTDKVIKLIYKSGKKLGKGENIIRNIYRTYYQIDLFSKKLYLRELIDAQGRYTEIAALVSGVYLAYEKLIEKMHEERIDDSELILSKFELAESKIEENTEYKDYFDQCRIFFKNICQDGSVFYEVLENKKIEEYFMFVLLAEEHIKAIKEKFARFDSL